MLIFLTRAFARFVRREAIAQARLVEAVHRAERGLIAADLGGGIIKQRIARPGKGSRGGYRVLISFKSRDRALFLFGFAKSERDNIDDDELVTLRLVAESFLTADATALRRAVDEGRLIEVPDAE